MDTLHLSLSLSLSLSLPAARRAFRGPRVFAQERRRVLSGERSGGEGRRGGVVHDTVWQPGRRAREAVDQHAAERENEDHQSTGHEEFGTHAGETLFRFCTAVDSLDQGMAFNVV